MKKQISVAFGEFRFRLSNFGPTEIDKEPRYSLNFSTEVNARRLPLALLVYTLVKPPVKGGRGLFEKQKSTGPNFIDWYQQLRIVISVDDKLEQPISPAQQVALEALAAHAARNYNMHGMGKMVNELHAMLKLHEQTLPKKDAHALHVIRSGKRNFPQYLAKLLKNKKLSKGASDLGSQGKSTKTRHVPDRMCLNVNAKEHESGDLGEPAKFKSTLLDPESDKWLNAMNQLALQKEDHGAVHTYKAHLIAKGFTQTYRVDYEETFSSVADIRAIRILIAIVRKFNSALGVVPIIEKPIKMYCDNTGAIAIPNESEITKGARHFRAKVHYLHEVIEYDDIKLKKVHTNDNLTDPFTKALAFIKHSEHTKNIGMLPAVNARRLPLALIVYTLVKPPMTTSVVKNLLFKGFFEKQKSIGPNFIDWYQQLRIVISFDDMLEQLISPAPLPAQAGQQVATEALAAHAAWVRGSKEIAEVMLMTIEPEIQ
nr:zinc finger, CCHC-type [Tanacetum cinerariifolium]